MDCVFCKIVNGEIPAKKVYEDEKTLAFYDLEPQAPVHILIIPKMHIASIDEINSENSDEIAAIFEVAAKIARQLSLDGGYRVVSNTGKDGGQTVPHLHFHLLAGRALQWPPG